MHFKNEEDGTHVYCDEGESEQDVLRAIAIASFSSAPSVGMGLLHFNKGSQLTPEQADRFIDNDTHYVLCMEYVEGRGVKTYLTRIEPGHFLCVDHIFERDRGPVSKMLEDAQALLGGNEPAELNSTMYLYEGEALDRRATEYFYKANDECKRKPGESDWDYRKRIFVDHHDLAPEEALYFIMGGTLADFDEMEMMLVLINADSFGSRSGRKRFADSLAGDPLKHRRNMLAQHAG
jgi:hypothetical protein